MGRLLAALSLSTALLIAPLAAPSDRVNAAQRAFIRVLTLYRLGGFSIGYFSFTCRRSGGRFATAWTGATATEVVEGFISGRRKLKMTVQPGQSVHLPLNTHTQSWAIHSATEPETIDAKVAMERPRYFTPCLSGRTRSSLIETSNSHG